MINFYEFEKILEEAKVVRNVPLLRSKNGKLRQKYEKPLNKLPPIPAKQKEKLSKLRQKYKSK